MNHKSLPNHLIFLTLFGSRAYGTSTPTSDWDVRGVGIAPLTTYFGTRPWQQIQGGSPFLDELLRKQHPKFTGELDSEVYNLTKFVRLATDANPNIYDILFSHPDDWLFRCDAWQHLYDNRHLFLSMRVRHTYTGYAMSQLKRIKSHRSWLLQPPSQKPTRADFGLPEHHSLVPKDIQDLANSMITKKQEEWQLDAWLERMEVDERDDFQEAIKQYFEMVHGRPYNPNDAHEREQASIQLGMPNELFQRLEAERKYKQSMHQWKQYESWKQNRNQTRATLEAKHGYDTKFAMHLVRLLFSAEEILTTGDLSVRHPQASLLQDVRNGAWSYDKLIHWATEKETHIASLAAQKPLPRQPNQEAIDQLVTRIILDFYDPQKG